MLTITTDNKQVQIRKDLGAISAYNKSSLHYTVSEQGLSLYMLNSRESSYFETFANGITLNGEALTAENASEKLSVLFTAGGDGSNDYSTLSNKPGINNVELSGNKTSAELGLASATDLKAKANLYIPEVKELSKIPLGENLRGMTLVFDTNTPLAITANLMIQLNDGTSYIRTLEVNKNYITYLEGVTTTLYIDDEWQLESFTFPDDKDYIVTYKSFGASTTYIPFVATKYQFVIDIKQNYQAIQAITSGKQDKAPDDGKLYGLRNGTLEEITSSQIKEETTFTNFSGVMPASYNAARQYAICSGEEPGNILIYMYDIPAKNTSLILTIKAGNRTTDTEIMLPDYPVETADGIFRFVNQTGEASLPLAVGGSVELNFLVQETQEISNNKKVFEIYILGV